MAGKPPFMPTSPQNTFVGGDPSAAFLPKPASRITPASPAQATGNPLFGLNPATGVPYTGQQRRDTMAAEGRPQQGLIDPSWDKWFDQVDLAGFNASGKSPTYRSDTMKFANARQAPSSAFKGTIYDDPGSSWQGLSEGNLALSGLKSASGKKK